VAENDRIEVTYGKHLGIPMFRLNLNGTFLWRSAGWTCRYFYRAHLMT